jgi:hypothetical protein
MEPNVAEIKVKGKAVKVPAACVEGATVVVTGRWLRTAAVQDEEWLEGKRVGDPEAFVRAFRQQNLGADLFTFVEKLPETKPRHPYPWVWDNAAAIPITTFDEWWEKHLPQVTRKNIRRAAKRGVFAKIVEFSDDLVRGIIEIHNDTPTRQGEPFAHYGKDFDLVKSEYGTFLETSEWIGAYVEEELIGIIKLIKMGKVAGIMQIITKTKHYDKRPTNVLIAKAVEVCQQQGIEFLVYGKFVYGNKTKSSLTEFKRRCGFQRIDFPRYYIPLSLKGRIAMKLKLHLGLLGILPPGLISLLYEMRARYYRWVLIPLTTRQKPGAASAMPNGSAGVESEAGES